MTIRTCFRKWCKLSSKHGVCWSLSFDWAVPSKYIRSRVGAGGGKLHVSNVEKKMDYTSLVSDLSQHLSVA